MHSHPTTTFGRPSPQAGFALITALLVMVVVVLLGTGTLYMTQGSLRISENVRTSAAARHNAEIGLEFSLIYLEEYLKEHGQLPTAAEFEAPPTIGVAAQAVSYRLASKADYVGYAVSSVSRGGNEFQRVTLQVEGLGPRGGSYVSELVAEVAMGESGGSGVLGLFAQGVSARHLVTMNGGPTFIDAGVHGNRGYTLNGFKVDAFETCSNRAENGTCLATRSYTSPPYPISAADDSTSYTCNVNPGNSDICDRGPVNLVQDPFVDPETGQARFDPSYDGIRNQVLCSYAVNPNGPCDSPQLENLNNLECSVRLNNPNMNKASDMPALGFVPGAVVCISSGVSFPSGADLRGVTVIARSHMNFNGKNHNFDDAVLVSLTSGVNLNGDHVLRNTRVFSESGLNFNGKTKAIGTTTLASNGHINFNGSTGNNDGASRLAVISGGDITFNGSADTWGTFLAGGNFNQNGKADIFGGVVALGSATFNGKLTVDAGVDIQNPDLPQGPGGQLGEVSLVSRR